MRAATRPRLLTWASARRTKGDWLPSGPACGLVSDSRPERCQQGPHAQSFDLLDHLSTGGAALVLTYDRVVRDEALPEGAERLFSTARLLNQEIMLPQTIDGSSAAAWRSTCAPTFCGPPSASTKRHAFIGSNAACKDQ